ncbi:MAG: glycosyltransferase family 39 protein [Hyphomonadaceae bacterium]|nr:glycosyltransferase family 39 protein [Hyphomonadaceae bacterium]
MGAMLDRLSTGFRPYVVISLLLLACALPGFIALQPLDRDESRFVQATTQMFESGDFIRISFQDEPRNKKPIGIHWFQAASVAASGGPQARNIWMFRVPSILGALLCALATFKIGALLYGRREGLIAGAAIACSLLLSTEAGIAKTDAALAGFTALSYLGLAAIRTKPARAWGPWAFWLGFALAALIKGPIGPLVIILSVIVLLVWERDRAWLQGLWHWPSVTLAVLVVVPWYVAIWQATNGTFFTDAIGQDLAPKLSGGAENPAVPPGAHALLSPLLLWPGSILIPAAIWTGWTLRKDPRVRFLLAWAIPGWLLFELAPTKLAHYTLPVHGAIFVLGAIGILAGAWNKALVRRCGLALFALGGLVLAIAPVALAGDVAPSAHNVALYYSAMIAMISVTALVLVIRKSVLAGVNLALAAVITSIIIKGVFVPSLDELNLSARVSAALQQEGLHPRLSDGQTAPLIGFGYQEPSLIFATRSDSALSSIEAATSAARAGSGVVVAQDSLDALNGALASKGLTIVSRGIVIEGLNYSKGDPISLLIGQVQQVESVPTPASPLTPPSPPSGP